MKNSDYIRFLCSMGYNNTAISILTGFPTKCHKSHKFLLNMNLPSITIPELKQPLTVSRTVTNVGPVKSNYTARVVAPIGISVIVEPSTLAFSSKRKKMKFKVTFSSKLRVQSRFSFGYLLWEDGLHEVRIPLAVRFVVHQFCAQTVEDLHMYEDVQVHPLTLIKLLLNILNFFILLLLILYI